MGRVKSSVPLEEDEYVSKLRRIEECELVVNELEESRVWQVFIKDLDSQRKRLDDSWQNILEPKQFEEARVLKLAISHITVLKDSYKNELESLKAELEQLENTGEEIIKDYDTETIME